jgi:hypothetical protein
LSVVAGCSGRGGNDGRRRGCRGHRGGGGGGGDDGDDSDGYPQSSSLVENRKLDVETAFVNRVIE